jgi:hypothetical protein
VTDFHDDALVAGAFAAFRTEVGPYVRPIGTAAAHETVRHRRRVRLVTVAAAVALVIAVPVAAFAATGGLNHGPGPVPASGGPSTAPSATPSTSPSPSDSPTPLAADGRIPKTELDHATLDIPAWGPAGRGTPACATGSVAFTNGYHNIADSFALLIDQVLYADVDHDGAQETVVRLSCGGQGNTYQVVVFDRDAADPSRIRTLGQVAVDSDTVRAICDLRVDDDGGVEVQAADFPLPLLCETGGSPAQFQWRKFAWNGTAFTQVAGPTSFPVNPKVTDLKVTSTDLTFGAPAGGLRHGTLTVTVRNAGPSAVPVRVLVGVPAGVDLVAQAGCGTQTFPQPVVDVTCQYGTLAVGGTRVVTLQFTAANPVTPRFITQASARAPDGYGDWNDKDNTVAFTLKF